MALVSVFLTVSEGNLCAAAFAATDNTPSTESRQVRTLTHIRVLGDLDAMKLAEQTARALEVARSEKNPTVVLELDGKRWRSDVVLAMARACKHDRGSSQLIVYLANETGSREIGTGQMSLALLADACYMSPKVKLTFSPGDDLRALMPEESNHEQIARDLRAMAWTGLQERGGDPLLLTLAPRPSSALMLARVGEGDNAAWKLSPTPIAGAEMTTIARADHAQEPASASMTTETALRTGLCKGVAANLNEIVSRQGLKVGRTRRETITSGLGGARQSLEQGLREIDEVRRRSEAAIDAVYRLKSNDVLVRQRRTGEEQRPMLEAAQARLMAIELLTQEYPELLTRPPPSATIVGQTASTTTKAWREAFNTRRSDLSKLLDRARTLIEKDPH